MTSKSNDDDEEEIPQVAVMPVIPSIASSKEAEAVEDEAQDEERGEYCDDCDTFTVYEKNGKMSCFQCGAQMESSSLVNATEFNADGQVRLYSNQPHNNNNNKNHTGNGTIRRCEFQSCLRRKSEIGSA